MDDIDFEDLLDWVEGRLDPVAAAEVRRAVDEADADPDSPHRNAIAWILSFHEQRRAIVYPDPPPVLRARLQSLFNGRRRDDADQFLAELISDSRTGVNAAGVRGTDLDRPDQLVYLSAGIDLVLDVSIDSGTVTVCGQVLPRHGSGAGYEIRAGGAGPVKTDDNGAFELGVVDASVTMIRVTAEGFALDVPVDFGTDS